MNTTTETIALIDPLAPEAYVDVLAHEALTHRYMKRLALCKIVHFGSYLEIMHAVETGRCQYGIVPIRHSIRGMMDEIGSYWFQEKEKGNNTISIAAEELIGYGSLLETRFHLVRRNAPVAFNRQEDKTAMIINLTAETSNPEDIRRVLLSIQAEDIAFYPVHTEQAGLSTFYLEFVSRYISPQSIDSILCLWTKSAYVLGRYECWTIAK
jgi:prephenate dehydratase